MKHSQTGDGCEIYWDGPCVGREVGKASRVVRDHGK